MLGLEIWCLIVEIEKNKWIFLFVPLSQRKCLCKTLYIFCFSDQNLYVVGKMLGGKRCGWIGVKYACARVGRRTWFIEFEI
jgi:hypothetical protein